MKLEIKQSDALEIIEHEDLIDLLIREPGDSIAHGNLKEFTMYNNRVSRGLINALLMFVIALETKDKPKGVLPNAAYLRKVLETWKLKKITTVPKAFKLFKQYLDTKKQNDEQNQDIQAHQMSQIKPGAHDPDWMDLFIEDIKNMKG